MGNKASTPARFEESFVSLGMVVIDEIRLPSRPPKLDVPGGSGIYATLGYRLFARRAQSSKVGCLVLAGNDFPDTIRKRLKDWNMKLVLNVNSDKLSTRGLLEYEDSTFGPKKFRYTTTPLKIPPKDLEKEISLLSATAFHLLATPGEIQEQIPELISLRNQHGIEQRPFLVWEPLPASCTTSNCPNFLAACRLVDVFSPNHLELAALFEDTVTDEFDPDKLEKYATEVAQTVGTEDRGTVIVRAGKHGSLTTLGSSRNPVWLPAYYQCDSAKLVDPTGAGNAFLGGYLAGWQLSQDAVKASAYGNVAASFALEQIGLPTRLEMGDREIWNGEDVLGRFAEYASRLESSITRGWVNESSFKNSCVEPTS